MVKFNYLSIVIILINMKWTYCYVNYQLFKGFDLPVNSTELNDNIMFEYGSHEYNNTQTATAKTTDVINVTLFNDKISTKTPIKKPFVKLKNFKAKCPETEHPMSLGTYEIPTQRDLVLFTKRILLKMFNNYHAKALFLLKDIKEVTRATQEFEKKCRGQSKVAYKNCVKLVSKQCVMFTKDLVAAMEKSKAAVTDLIEESTCKMTDMKTDPIQLIKTLATNEVSLDFALPSFLTLIGGCSAYCSMYVIALTISIKSKDGKCFKITVVSQRLQFLADPTASIATHD